MKLVEGESLKGEKNRVFAKKKINKKQLRLNIRNIWVCDKDLVPLDKTWSLQEERVRKEKNPISILIQISISKET